MRVTLYDEEYTPSPQEMAEEFWESNAERQTEILYSLALICKYDLPNFCNQMFSIGEQLKDYSDEREDVIFCLKEMVNQIER
jgi:hypothetical protein